MIFIFMSFNITGCRIFRYNPIGALICKTKNSIKRVLFSFSILESPGGIEYVLLAILLTMFNDPRNDFLVVNKRQMKNGRGLRDSVNSSTSRCCVFSIT